MLNRIVRGFPLSARDIERVEEYLKTPPPRFSFLHHFFFITYALLFAFFVCHFLTYKA